MNRRALALLRLVFGLLTFVALGETILSLVDAGTFDPVNFFSYFTVLSNVIGAILMLVGAARWRAGHDATIDLLRGAAVVYLAVTFIVFAVLLANTDVDLATPWVNTVLHELIPIVVLLDWLVDPPEVRFSMRQVALWLAFPIVWVGYVLVRGALVGKYPYPFLDPANGGYASVAIYLAGITVLFVVLSAIVHWLANVMGARRTSLT